MKKFAFFLAPLMSISLLTNCNSGPKQYTVTFDSNGGSEVSTQTVKENEKVNKPTDPIKNGYILEKWCTDEALTIGYDFSNLVTSDFTLYAKYSITNYTINYHMPDGATHTNPTSYTIESNDINLTNATITKDGYEHECNGWHVGSTAGESITTIHKGSTGNLDLYTSATAITYKITYKNVVKSEHSTDPESYTVEEAITLSTPTRADWTFGGWYTDPEFKNKITNIPKGSYGDKTLYAKMIYCKNLKNCSWDEIKTVSEKGGARATFGNPGEQTKTVTINGTENQVRIIAYDYDELATSTKENPQYARITFEFTNTISGFTTNWNDKQDVNSTSYDFINASNLNECLQPNGNVYKMMPESLMKVIKTVNKKVDIHPNDKWIEGNYDTKLFPLSHGEIDGDINTYEYYKTDSQEKRKKNNTYYWLRSPHTNITAGFIAWGVNDDGSFGSYIVYNSSIAVALAFCI